MEYEMNGFIFLFSIQVESNKSRSSIWKLSKQFQIQKKSITTYDIIRFPRLSENNDKR